MSGLLHNATNRRLMIASVVCLLVLGSALLLPRPASSRQQLYDLGGPCKDQADPNAWKERLDAEKAGEWDRAVALQKEEVRGGCGIEYRWYDLVNTLLKAHRPAEASSVLQEMDARGFEVNPALIDTDFPEVAKFLDSKEFDASPLGSKIKRLEKISDDRRIKFRGVLNSLPASEKPPEDYVAKGACPFECCRFGDWTVLGDTQLVASPGSSRFVGTAPKGSRVVALTGEVHLRPEPVVVLVAGNLPKDSIVFVLDYLGEGYGHVYTRGKVVETALAYARYCFRPSESCWGETLLPPNEVKKSVWWVKVRLSNGVVGWTDKASNFGNNDACG